AALREPHHCYPAQFVTKVRILCPELWENYPYLSPLSDTDPGVGLVSAAIPWLIDVRCRCNEAPYHCIHDFLNSHLGLNIKPSVFNGDTYLSDLETSYPGIPRSTS